MISIITPVYNADAYLETCLKSVLEQDCRGWEWILVDDGSTDRSLTILNDFAAKDKRIRVISQKNAGPAAARNRALDEIRGEYATFIDADDWMAVGALSRLHQICETEKPDLILWDYTRFVNGDYLPSKNPWPPAGMLDQEALRRYELDLIFNMKRQRRQYAPFIWVRGIKTSVIRENGICFNTDLRRSEDTLFSIEVQRYCRSMYVLREPCVVYRTNLSSISHSYVKNYMQGMDRIYEDILAYAQKTGQEEMKKRAHYMYVFRTLFALREETVYKKFPEALGAIREMLRAPHLQQSLQEIGKNGTAIFGRRYTVLYRKLALPLYFLLKPGKGKGASR